MSHKRCEDHIAYLFRPSRSLQSVGCVSILALLLGGCGSIHLADSSVAPVSVIPTITSQPTDVSATLGQTATFSVTATGTGTIGYQWRENAVNIPGAISPGYTTAATTAASNELTFDVIVSDSTGSTTSSSATLTVTNTNPTIPTPASSPKFVYAHYMHCFVYGETPVVQGSEEWDAWTPSEFTYPAWWPESLAPGSNAGESSIATDFVLAQSAGLDALGVLTDDNPGWWAKYGSIHESVASVASTSSVKILPDLWLYGMQDFTAGSTADQIAAITQYGVTVKSWMDSYPNAFAKIDGRWVINYGDVATSATDPGEFEHFFDPWGGRSAFYVIANVQSSQEAAAWGPYVDAFSSWNPSQSWAGGDQTVWLPSTATSLGRAVSWPVTASYFETHNPWPNPRMMAEDLGVSRYIDRWKKALDNESRLVQIQTWNDMSEDSAVTDLNVRGTSLIDLTAYFAQWLHSGTEPAITTEKVFLFHHRQLMGTPYSQATKIALTMAWASDTPTTDYINVLTMLKSPATVSVISSSSQWTITAPAGFHEWLLYVPSIVTSYTGEDNSAYVQADSYPKTTAERDVTVLQSLQPGVPGVEVIRGGNVLLNATSRTGWPAAANWQDMSMIGDEWSLD
jgi:hypothetical protein